MWCFIGGSSWRIARKAGTFRSFSNRIFCAHGCKSRWGFTMLRWFCFFRCWISGFLHTCPKPATTVSIHTMKSASSSSAKYYRDMAEGTSYIVDFFSTLPWTPQRWTFNESQKLWLLFTSLVLRLETMFLCAKEWNSTTVLLFLHGWWSLLHQSKGA